MRSVNRPHFDQMSRKEVCPWTSFSLFTFLPKHRPQYRIEYGILVELTGDLLKNNQFKALKGLFQVRLVQVASLPSWT